MGSLQDETSIFTQNQYFHALLWRSGLLQKVRRIVAAAAVFQLSTTQIHLAQSASRIRSCLPSD
jgi:hypothetical protein